MFEPRKYQEESLDAVWRYINICETYPLVVAPTGSGKSIMIAMLADKIASNGGRLIVTAHRKELLKQNAKAYRLVSGGQDYGFYSAGLKAKCTDKPVIFAGIQSVFKRATEFGDRQFLLCDEVHRIDSSKDTTQYMTFLKDLSSINRWFRCVGYTATPYRTGTGCIVENGIFGDIAHETEIWRLMEMDPSPLARLVSKASIAKIDQSKLKIARGEFTESSMEEAFMEGDNVLDACTEMIAMADQQDRKHCIIFGVSVKHCTKIAEIIRDLTGEPVGEIYGHTLPLERDMTLRSFGEKKLRWMVNCNVLTEGFDAPHIDLVAFMRATTSPGLFAQGAGRGMRPAIGKESCTVLDFGANIERHGALTDKDYGKKKKKKDDDDAGVEPTKECPECESRCNISCVFCPTCGFMFDMKQAPNHEGASEKDLDIMQPDTPETISVYGMEMYRHKGKTDPETGVKKPDTLKAIYLKDPNGAFSNWRDCVSEWICIEHGGWAREKAEKWFKKFSVADAPTVIEDVLEAQERHMMRIPVALTIKKDGKYFRILDHHFEDERPEQSEWTAPPNTDAFFDPFEDETEDIPF